MKDDAGLEPLPLTEFGKKRLRFRRRFANTSARRRGATERTAAENRQTNRRDQSTHSVSSGHLLEILPTQAAYCLVTARNALSLRVLSRVIEARQVL
jgi:hypothetical protein